jgi:hypothetical protein
LQLWSILEKFTATPRANYDKTIKRTAFLFEDSEITKQILQHLRRFRNETVHAGTRTEQIEQLVYQLKQYVEALIFFHISNHFRFANIEQAAQLFDLPTNSEFLRSRIRLTQRAMKYRQINK